MEVVSVRLARITKPGATNECLCSALSLAHRLLRFQSPLPSPFFLSPPLLLPLLPLPPSHSDWKDHGASTGGYYKCNKFAVEKEDNDMSDAAKAKRELDR